MKKVNLLMLSTLLAVGFAACNRETDPEPLEQEVITTMNLKFTNIGDTSDVSTFSFVDPDGSSSGAPTRFDTIRLGAGNTYRMEVELLDESKTPASNITEEVEEEATEHQFFFIPAPANLVNIVYQDADKDSNPVGITSIVSTNQTGSGKLQVVLRHELNKSATGVKQGNIANAGGDTDIDVNFPIVIQ